MKTFLTEICGSKNKYALSCFSFSLTNPDALFAQALQAGATEVFPVGEEYGWRLGRLVDPFGLHWEIGRSLST